MRDRLPLLGLAFAILLGVVGLLFVRASARGEFAEPLSTYRSESDGARALYLVAQRLGLQPERRQLDFEHIEGTPELVLLGVEGDAPSADDDADGGMDLSQWRQERLGQSESKELLRAVEAGATLVYAVGREHPLLSELHVDFTPLDDAMPRELVPFSPTPFTRGVTKLQVAVAGYVEAPGALPLLVDPNAGASPVAVLISRGLGRVLVLAAPRLASNRALLDDDNAVFLVNALRELKPAGGAIAFDEYHHGFTSDRSVMGYAARFGLPWIVLQCVFALALWSSARRRLGPSEVLRDDPQHASADYLLAMARIYQRGKHRRHVAELLLNGVLRPLQTLTHLPRHTRAPEVIEALRARGRANLAAELDALVQRIGAELDEAQLLGIAQAASRLRDRIHTSSTLDTTA